MRHDCIYKILAALALAIIFLNFECKGQISGTIVYPLIGSSSAINPIPFAATVTDLLGTGWSVSYGVGPLGAEGISNTASPFPVLGVNTISFDITPTCPLCVLTGLSFEIEVGPGTNTGDMWFQVYNGATPISPLFPTPIPTGPIALSPPILPQSITSTTTFSIAFAHDGTVVDTEFLIRNLSLDITYNGACIPEPRRAGMALVFLSSALFMAYRLKRKNAAQTTSKSAFV